MSRVAELIQQIVGLLQEDESLQLEFARAFLTNRVLQRLFQADPELRETLRRFILTDALLQLPEKIEPLLQLPEKIEPLLQLPERVAALEAAVSELRTVVNRIEPVVIVESSTVLSLLSIASNPSSTVLSLLSIASNPSSTVLSRLLPGWSLQ
jgi:ATP phosphoribosyltransferase regulatory subunit HisZ